MGPAVMPGQDLSELAGPVGGGQAVNYAKPVDNRLPSRGSGWLRDEPGGRYPRSEWADWRVIARPVPARDLTGESCPGPLRLSADAG